MDLSSFTPDQIAQLKALLGNQQSNADGRSPFVPRQRHNLLDKPGIKDEFGRYIPTPLFIPSAEGIHGALEPPPFQQLLWSPPNRNGEQTEVTARSAKEVDDYIKLGYVTKPPAGHEVDPLEQIQAQFDALSEEDQRLLIEAQAQDKKARLQAALANLSEKDLEQLLGKAQKRGPGRPKKQIA